MEKLLVAVNERALCRILRSALREHYLVLQATYRADLKRLFLKHLPKVVLLDLCLISDAEDVGCALSLEWIIERHPAVKLIVLTAKDDRSGAYQALCQGAYGFHQKPVIIDELQVLVQRAFHLCAVEEQRCQLKDTVELETAGIEGIAGQCAALQRLFSSAGWPAPHVPGAVAEEVDGVVTETVWGETMIRTAFLGRSAPSREGGGGSGGVALQARQLTLKEARDRVEKRLVSEAIGNCGGNMTKASLLLGVSRPALYDLMKKYGISKGAVGA